MNSIFWGLGSGFVLGMGGALPSGSALSTQPASDPVLNEKVSRVAENAISKTGAILNETPVLDCSPADGVRNPFHPVIGRRGGIIGPPNPHIGRNGKIYPPHHPVDGPYGPIYPNGPYGPIRPNLPKSKIN